MPAEREPPEIASRLHRLNRWLDWWCEPPWRALLTWAALAVLSAWAADHGLLRLMLQGALFLTDLEAKASPTLSNFSLHLILPVNSMVLLVWFEPFVLRLNLVRGLAWFGLRLGLLVSGDLYGVRTPIAILFVLWPLTLLIWSMLAVAVLYGWRSRPWLSVVGGVLMALLHYSLLRAGVGFRPAVLWPGLAYAAVVLFGTRRIQDGRVIRDIE
jgi:hypothetical protein